MKVLLISTLQEDQEFAREVAKASGLSLEVFDTPEAAVAKAKEDPQTVLLVDVGTHEQFEDFKKHFAAVIGKRPEQIDQSFVHFISSKSRSEHSDLADCGLFAHFLLRNYRSTEEAGRHYGRIIRKLCITPSYGLESLISSDAKVKSIKLKHSSDRSNVINSIEEFLVNETAFKGRMAPVIATAVDELLMNAIYDAPTDTNGKPALETTPRNTPIPLEGKNAVELQIGYDDDYVAFTVIDLYGALDKSRLVSHLFRNYKENFTIDESVAGAGIGLATTFKTGGSLVFLSRPGERTEVTVMFRKTENYREFRDQFRFISIHIACDEKWISAPDGKATVSARVPTI